MDETLKNLLVTTAVEKYVTQLESTSANADFAENILPRMTRDQVKRFRSALRSLIILCERELRQRDVVGED